jgi:hypothetical protein
MKCWEIIADKLSKTGSNCCVSALDSRGRATFVADAHLMESGSLSGQMKS